MASLVTEVSGVLEAVSAALEKIEALAEATVVMGDNHRDVGQMVTLAYMIVDVTREVDIIVQEESKRLLEIEHAAKTAQDTCHHGPQLHHERFDHQFERPGT